MYRKKGHCITHLACYHFWNINVMKDGIWLTFFTCHLFRNCALIFILQLLLQRVCTGLTFCMSEARWKIFISVVPISLWGGCFNPHYFKEINIFTKISSALLVVIVAQIYTYTSLLCRGFVTDEIYALCDLWQLTHYRSEWHGFQFFFVSENYVIPP